MTVSLLFASQVNAVVYLIPLLAVISLVYNATRYELPQIIIQRSIRFFFTSVIIMGALMTLLALLSWNL
ncbi:hypothetical protein [Gimesia maris]|jgi:hypothetical protein|uniref:Uncharacterized protein n=1 Tax=Gimesia maris TaxID=122 RepID=A0A3D3R7Y7_9PLAN|nr:hypothetical protein [Gimesia maris]MAC53139.1 hypothetical protein [Gimesia sp.]HAW29352.1 hypothetical protein [Planctomycetaceae bacterium]EDL58465.1 hypothetical protein PM8797T_11926 [Gimesia maris DSM 8797]QDT81960.1 hypothetical protein Mal35_54500 [Gimesia maris]QDU17713.1 hypothetical protein CA11_55610 [Gimesia maris]|tara:strand:+ start:14626 stop:14832 length:207 start_codon:yes stop_codon:yes gene_type:complete